jgi:16S rRNA (guanine1207-N2)-methyltransferase
VTQYFDPEPDVTSAERTVELVLPDLHATLTTDRGVFSADQIDSGSKLLLLDGPGPTPGDQVLVDVGCGYGPIAYSLAVRNPTATVYAVDVNERARDLCRRNTEALGNVVVAAPGDVPSDLVVDRIWSNPPIRVGKTVLHELLLRWLGQLHEHGSAHLVVQKHLGADSLHRWLEQQGWAVHRRTSKKAFRLLDVTR